MRRAQCDYSDLPGTTVTSSFTYTPSGQLNIENDAGTYNTTSYAFSNTNSYDSNGNLTGTGSAATIVNGPNNQVQSVGSTSYLYDQDGNRFFTYTSPTSYDEYEYDNRNDFANNRRSLEPKVVQFSRYATLDSVKNGCLAQLNRLEMATKNPRIR
jgi:hypothetical protein